MKDRPLFDFVIPGVPKCGTTYTYQLLKEHPEVAIISEKDGLRGAYFKETELQKKEDLERSLLDRRTATTKVYGECVETYARIDGVAKKISKQNINTKIILCLRNPYERSYSHARHTQALGFHGDIGPKNSTSNIVFTESFYYEYLKSFFDTFPKENILILPFRLIKENPKEYRMKLFTFLDIDPNFKPSTEGVKLNDSAFKESLLGKFFHLKIIPFFDFLKIGNTLRSSEKARSLFYKLSTQIGVLSKNKEKQKKNKDLFFRKIDGLFEEDLQKIKNEFNITL